MVLPLFEQWMPVLAYITALTSLTKWMAMYRLPLCTVVAVQQFLFFALQEVCLMMLVKVANNNNIAATIFLIGWFAFTVVLTIPLAHFRDITATRVVINVEALLAVAFPAAYVFGGNEDYYMLKWAVVTMLVTILLYVARIVHVESNQDHYSAESEDTRYIRDMILEMDGRGLSTAQMLSSIVSRMHLPPQSPV